MKDTDQNSHFHESKENFSDEDIDEFSQVDDSKNEASDSTFDSLNNENNMTVFDVGREVRSNVTDINKIVLTDSSGKSFTASKCLTCSKLFLEE